MCAPLSPSSLSLSLHCFLQCSSSLALFLKKGAKYTMEIQRSPLFSWSYYSQSKSMEELRHCLLYTTLELETTKIAVEEELKKRDHQLIHLRELLDKAVSERDEAQDTCQRLLLDNLVLQQQQQQQQQLRILNPLSGVSRINEDDPRREKESKNGFSSSECDESIASPQLLPALDSMVPDKPLPEKGKLLQEVMKAGPLLQTLLVAGPLPQWRHPPPPIESSEIPPVKIPSPPLPLPLPPPVFLQDALLSCGRVCGKRGVPEEFDSPAAAASKYQRALLF